jgi:uncharacterized protein
MWRARFDDGYLPAEYRLPTAAERCWPTRCASCGQLRQARSLPKDDKLNAGLNGLALSAFSQASALIPAIGRAPTACSSSC